MSPVAPALAGRFFPAEPRGSPESMPSHLGIFFGCFGLQHQRTAELSSCVGSQKPIVFAIWPLIENAL